MSNKVSYFSGVIFALVMSFAAATPTMAAASHSQFTLNRFVFDPGNSGFASSNFVTMDGFTALRLKLTGNVAYPPGVATGARILLGSAKLPNMTLKKLAFNITSDSQNAGGAPRFNIYDNQGNYWLMTCLECVQVGTTSVLPNGSGKPYQWLRITCNPANIPELSNGTTPGLPFTNATIVTRIDVLFDASIFPGPGYANMSNISLNDNPPSAPNLIPISN